MSKIKNGGLDQYGTEPFKQQQFGTAGVKGVNDLVLFCFMSASVCDCISTYVYCGVVAKRLRVSVIIASLINCSVSEKKLKLTELCCVIISVCS